MTVGDAAGVGRSGTRALEARLDAFAARLDRLRARFRASSVRLPGFIVLLYGTTAAWILLWAWYDARILVGAFPSAPGYHPDLNVYWISTWWILFPATTILLFRRHAWFPVLALAIGGWEDLLFYWVQGRPVPPDLAYLPQTPTAVALYARAAVFALGGAVGALVIRRPELRIRFVPPEIVMPAAGLLGNFWVFLASIPSYLAVQRLVRRRGRNSRREAPRAH